MRIPFLPEFEDGAVPFEDFLCSFVAEVSSTLIRCSRAAEKSAMLHPINPRNGLLQNPTFYTLLQVVKGGVAVEFTALQNNKPLSRLQHVAIVEFFDAHWFPLKGNREMIREFPYRKPEGLKRALMR
jgi:hypothetical protein